jgi:TRAP-type transport system periplasmic protein
MAWRFIDGGGEGPNRAFNKEGEYFVFGLSRYRDALKLTPVRGEVSPRNFRDQPWHRLTEQPPRSALSRRCPPPAAALSR